MARVMAVWRMKMLEQHWRMHVLDVNQPDVIVMHMNAFIIASRLDVVAVGAGAADGAQCIVFLCSTIVCARIPGHRFHSWTDKLTGNDDVCEQVKNKDL